MYIYIYTHIYIHIHTLQYTPQNKLPLKLGGVKMSPHCSIHGPQSHPEINNLYTDIHHLL
jgi:hypothetical protein